MPDNRPSHLAGRTLLFLPRYPQVGPSSRLRMLQYIPAFEAAGATVQVAPFFDDAYLRDYFETGKKRFLHAVSAYGRRLSAVLAARPDLIWIEKEVFPYLPGPAERLVRLTGAPYVVDYDDAIYHLYDQHRSAVARRLLSRKLDPLLGGAEMITAGNDYLDDYATAHGASRVIQIPTVVDLDRYPVAALPSDQVLRVAWIGTPRNIIYLAPLIRALNRLSQERRVVFVTIGAPPLDGLAVQQERHAWTEETEAALLGQIHVGVMPLPDTPWERGKCGYKLIQYMASGRPVIGSPVGMTSQIVTSDVGFLADSEDDWLAALRTLGSDPALRERMGIAARKRVAEQYSLQVTAPKIVGAFSDLLEMRAAA